MKKNFFLFNCTCESRRRNKGKESDPFSAETYAWGLVGSTTAETDGWPREHWADFNRRCSFLSARTSKQLSAMKGRRVFK